MSCARIFWVCLLGTVALAGCGGKVVVDQPSGEGGGGGGTGGAGQVGQGPVGPGSGSSTNVVGAVGPGSTSTGVVSSGTGGQICGGQADCKSCADCALQNLCANIWKKCLAMPDCTSLADCVDACPNKQCVEKCSVSFPNGVDIYNETASCVVCEACFSECKGSTQGCPP
jgi:hypothetical protein